MKLIINGQEKEVRTATLPELLAAENLSPEQQHVVAVARNGHVVPRTRWAETALENGDRIEIVKPFVGG